MRAATSIAAPAEAEPIAANDNGAAPSSAPAATNDNHARADASPHVLFDAREVDAGSVLVSFGFLTPDAPRALGRALGVIAADLWLAGKRPLTK